MTNIIAKSFFFANTAFSIVKMPFNCECPDKKASFIFIILKVSFFVLFLNRVYCAYDYIYLNRTLESDGTKIEWYPLKPGETLLELLGALSWLTPFILINAFCALLSKNFIGFILRASTFAFIIKIILLSKKYIAE